jgi:type IV pilus assembly protein PilB
VVPSLGRDFPDTLRNALRCDPDVIMVGEVRDELTAEISMRAAISGHLLLTTLHAMEASAAPIQLVRMGVPAYQVADAIRAVISQRLVRVLCPHCRIAQAPTADELVRLEYDPEAAQQIVDNAASYQFHHHNEEGCSECTRGYRGRTMVSEVMLFGDHEKKLVMSDELSSLTLRQMAVQGGMHTLQQDGVEKAAHGVTSLAELRRVVG